MVWVVRERGGARWVRNNGKVTRNRLRRWKALKEYLCWWFSLRRVAESGEKNEVVLLASARLIIFACTEAGLAGWMLKHRGEEASLAHD